MMQNITVRLGKERFASILSEIMTCSRYPFRDAGEVSAKAGDTRRALVIHYLKQYKLLSPEQGFNMAQDGARNASILFRELKMKQELVAMEERQLSEKLVNIKETHSHARTATKSILDSVRKELRLIRAFFLVLLYAAHHM